MSKSILFALVLTTIAGATPLAFPESEILEARQYSSSYDPWADRERFGPSPGILAVIIVISVVVGIGIIGGLIWKFWVAGKAAKLAHRHTDIYANRVDNAYYNPNANGYNASNGYGSSAPPAYGAYVPPPPPASHHFGAGRHNHHHSHSMHHQAHHNAMDMHNSAHNAAVSHATHHSTMH